MKILVACEESQAVTIELRKRGHEAYSCDILPCSGGHPEWHLQGDVLSFLDGLPVFAPAGSYIKKWDMMIAFPPCTHLAVSGAAWFKEKIADGRQQEGIDFFMKLVNAPIEKIAIENPVSIMSTKYRKPDQIINPFQFGDPVPKKTCLWLKNLPLLTPTNIVKPEYIIGKKDGKKYSIIHYQSVGKDPEERGKIRSKTFPGIAKAMAEQWSDTLE
jgi:hypothetical protein